MQKARQVIRYTFWFILGIIICLLGLGMMRFNFDVSAYFTYLNNVDTTLVSRSTPSSIVDVFVPSTELIEQTQQPNFASLGTGSSSGSLELDAEFEAFFGDFTAEDLNALSEEEWFGFALTGEQMNTGETLDDVLSDEEKRLLLQRLQSRKDRLTEVILTGDTGQALSGQTVTGQ